MNDRTQIIRLELEEILDRIKNVEESMKPILEKECQDLTTCNEDLAESQSGLSIGNDRAGQAAQELEDCKTGIKACNSRAEQGAMDLAGRQSDLKSCYRSELAICKTEKDNESAALGNARLRETICTFARFTGALCK